MLTVTHRAAVTLAERIASQGLPPNCGYRLTEKASEPELGSLQLKMAAAPEPEDTVVCCGATNVFVPDALLTPLGDMVLDVADEGMSRPLVLRRPSSSKASRRRRANRLPS